MMFLQALHSYALARGLVDSIEIAERPVHLALCLRKDGSVDRAGVWRALVTEESDPKGNARISPGAVFKLPAFPGVNSGGKANFLADDAAKVLGIDTKTGEPFPDDATSNAAKSFRHFWQRIADAHAATGLESLQALLAFRQRYLDDPDIRRALPEIRIAPYGKKDPKPTLCAFESDEPIPIEKRTIMFSIENNPVFSPGSPVHDYWKKAFASERFAEPASNTSSDVGLCLVTGQENQAIAESHRTPIKGVPGLPPIGGYLVSFDDATPSLRSYGLEKAFQAPVSEQAAAAYALGLNDILAQDRYTRRINDFVLCTWIHESPDLTESVNGVLVDPNDDAVKKFLDAADNGLTFGGWSTKHFRSVTLAANGGRVVVRRWLDEPLSVVADSIKAWLSDLSLGELPSRPDWKPKAGKKSPSPAAAAEAKTPRPYRAIDALAWSSTRTPSDVRSEVYDALLRSAYQKESSPGVLLPAILHRLRIAAIESGSNIRFHFSRFALIKLILIRSEAPTMPVQAELCQTDDAPYNCGRLLAVLDDIQREAQGKVGADILARFYGNASTFPCNVFPRLLRLARSHLNKLGRDDPGAFSALQRRVNEICALFPGAAPNGAPAFPQQLDIHGQGRFALGFYQQKAHDQRERDRAFAGRTAAAKKAE
jgi:CRISPR-associated protein Cas8c/Csd1 subtype I-C